MVLMGKELLCQLVTNGKGRSGSTVLNARLIEDARKMIGHRAFADHEFLGDLAVALALGHQSQDLYLTWAESGRHQLAGFLSRQADAVARAGNAQVSGCHLAQTGLWPLPAGRERRPRQIAPPRPVQGSSVPRG